MPPILSGFAFQSRQQYHLCAVLVQLVFLKMTHDKFHELDEIRQIDEKMFELAVEYLMALGLGNLTDELVERAVGQAVDAMEKKKVSADGMDLLLHNMNLHTTASKIRDMGSILLLDYIAEKGWRCRV